MKKWMDEADKNDPMDISGPASVPDRKKIVTNGYAKVWGKISSFNNRRSVTAHVVRPLTDMNEYHFHFLEATAIHLYFTRGPSPAKIKADAAKGISAAGGAAGGAGENIGVDGRPLPHLSPIARRVYDTLSNTAQSREGLHVQHLATLLGLPVSDVYNASGELRSHGLIFDTVDDDTWALMEF